MNCSKESVGTNGFIDREDHVADTMNTGAVADDLERLGAGWSGGGA